MYFDGGWLDDEEDVDDEGEFEDSDLDDSDLGLNELLESDDGGDDGDEVKDGRIRARARDDECSLSAVDFDVPAAVNIGT